MKKLCLWLPGRQTYLFLKFWHFNFSNFQTTLVNIFAKKPLDFKIDFEIIDKVLPLHRYLWSEISRQWNNFLNFFNFLNLLGRAFCFLNLWNEGNIKDSISLILLKYIVLVYSNGNESFTGRLFSNYEPLNMLFHFFRYLIYSVFHVAFVKNFMKKLSFFSSDVKNPFQDVVYYWKLRCLTLWNWNVGLLGIRFVRFWGCFFRNEKTLTFWIFMNQIFR